MDNTEDEYFYWVVTAFPTLKRTHIETGVNYVWSRGEWKREPDYWHSVQGNITDWQSSEKITKEDALLFVLANNSYVY